MKTKLVLAIFILVQNKTKKSDQTSRLFKKELICKIIKFLLERTLLEIKLQAMCCKIKIIQCRHHTDSLKVFKLEFFFNSKTKNMFFSLNDPFTFFL